jgi:hypothetical protein
MVFLVTDTFNTQFPEIARQIKKPLFEEGGFVVSP